MTCSEDSGVEGMKRFEMEEDFRVSRNVLLEDMKLQNPK